MCDNVRLRMKALPIALEDANLHLTTLSAAMQRSLSLNIKQPQKCRRLRHPQIISCQESYPTAATEQVPQVLFD